MAPTSHRNGYHIHRRIKIFVGPTRIGLKTFRWFVVCIGYRSFGV